MRIRPARVAIAVAALFAATAPAAAAAPGYPAAEILAAFTGACSEAGNSDANLAAIERAGWTRAAEDADTPLSRLVYHWLHDSYSLDSSTDFGAQFRKTVAGRTLYVLLSETHYGGSMSGSDSDCTLFDFDAPRVPSTAELGAWSGRTPDEIESGAKNDDGATVIKYDGGSDGKHPDRQVYFLSRHIGAKQFFHGLQLTATMYKGSR